MRAVSRKEGVLLDKEKFPVDINTEESIFFVLVSSDKTVFTNSFLRESTIERVRERSLASMSVKSKFS